MSSQDKKVVIFIDPEKKSEGAYQELIRLEKEIYPSAEVSLNHENERINLFI